MVEGNTKTRNGENTKFDSLSNAVIGEAIAVHRELGPGFLERIYEEALCVALADAKIPFQRQVAIKVRFRGHSVGAHRLDLLVDDNLILELKACGHFAPEHFSTLLSYLKATGKRIGLLLNFGTPTLEIRRVVH